MFGMFKKKKDKSKAFELTEQEIKEIEEFKRKQRVKPIVSELTVVCLPSIDFNVDIEGFHTKELMKALAEAGVNVIYINDCEEYYQVDDIEYPYEHLPNFHLVRYGTPSRHLFRGRVVYWVTNSEFVFSVRTARANLLIYNPVDMHHKDWNKYLVDMEKESDLVFYYDKVFDEKVGKHNKNVHYIELEMNTEYDVAARLIIDKIAELPNRKPLLE